MLTERGGARIFVIEELIPHLTAPRVMTWPH